MKKSFDQMCAEILGEILNTTTPGASAANTQQQPQQNQNQQQPQQNQQQYQKTPTPNAPQQQGDDELLNALQQKMQDEKFKQQLLQMLKTPQQPGVNKVG